MSLRVEYDPAVDAAYVYLRDADDRPLCRTRRLDDYRLLDLADDGTAIGVDFMVVSRGVDLAGIPQVVAVSEALTSVGVAVRGVSVVEAAAER